MTLNNNRGPPGPKGKGGLPLKNIKLKGSGVKPRAVKSKTPLPRAAMRRLWLQTKSKTIRVLRETPFHQEEQNTPGNQAAGQMVDATVKAPAQAVYQAGKKLAQDTAHKLKERREAVKTAQAVGEKASAGNCSPSAGEPASAPKETPTASPNRSVRERRPLRAASPTSSEGLTPGKATAGTPSHAGIAPARQGADAVASSPKKPGNTGLGKTGQRPIPRQPKAPRWEGKPTLAGAKSPRFAGKSVKASRPSFRVTESATQAVTQASVQKGSAMGRRARTAASQAKSVAKGVSSAAKAAAGAARSLGTLLLAGGGAALAVALLVCLAGLVVGSAFGIFFSGEDTGTGQTIRTAIAQVNQEYQDKLEEIQASHTYDTLEVTGSQAVWKEVLAVYAVKTTTDADGVDVASVDEKKIRLLSEVFWEMNQIAASVEARTETVVDTATGEDGEMVDTEATVTQDVLVITVSHKTAWEMAELLHFDKNQREQLRELLSEEYDGLWNELLYGIAGGSGDLVAVALSQVGQVGGEPYWSWYGFGSRVEWCACFVSWCANQCGLLDSGAVPKFAGVGTGVQWFQSRGQWLDGSATPEPGMIIFFKWYGSDSLIADHVGIVERVEDGRIYTIEGNSDNMVRQNNYPVGYGEIKGYGAVAP